MGVSVGDGRNAFGWREMLVGDGVSLGDGRGACG